MIYTVTCNPAVDYVMHLPQLQLGEVNRSCREEVYFGGKGINVSLILNALGIPSKALGFVAGFTGHAIAQGVQAQGVETDFITLSQGLSRINVKLKGAAETELNGQGPAITTEELEALFAKLEGLTAADTLVLAGSIPSTLPSDLYEQVFHRLAGSGVRIVVDAAGELLLRVLPHHPFLIKPNHHELGELFGVRIESHEEAFRYAAALQNMGAEHVLVSMAEQGAVLLDAQGGRYDCGVCHGEIRNSVGAGDSMLAGFLAGLEQGDYAHALRLGTAAGGATTFSEGLASGEEILEQLKTLEP